jgi:hypothetical protein
LCRFSQRLWARSDSFSRCLRVRRTVRRVYVCWFFEERGFYPDFILWIVDENGQRIVFVEPHGMLHAKAYIHDDKARLHERMPELAKEIGKRSRRQDIALDSHIIPSTTPFDDLRQRYDDGTWDRDKFAQRHILFPERSQEYDYCSRGS